MFVFFSQVLNVVQYMIWIYTMSTGGYETRHKIACVKCRQRHKPPLGVSCPQIKAVRTSARNKNKQTPQQPSNMGTSDGLTDNVTPAGSSTPHDEEAQPPQGGTQKPTKKRMTNSEVLDKLDFMMQKFGEFEKCLEQQEQKSGGSLSALLEPSAHSSPKPKLTHQTSTYRSAQCGTRKSLHSVDFLREEGGGQMPEVIRGLQSG